MTNRHPSDMTPRDEACENELAKLDNRTGQGVDPYFAWAYREGWQAALESRVLAERKDIDQSEDWVNPAPMFAPGHPLFTHPTPDDASLAPVTIWIIPDMGSGLYTGLTTTRSKRIAEKYRGQQLYRKTAIDRARQSGEEGKS
jgi:hypothetical protein